MDVAQWRNRLLDDFRQEGPLDLRDSDPMWAQTIRENTRVLHLAWTAGLAARSAIHRNQDPLSPLTP